MNWTGKILIIEMLTDRILFTISKNSDASEVIQASLPELSLNMTIYELAIWAYSQLQNPSLLSKSEIVPIDYSGKIVRIDNRAIDRVDFWISLNSEGTDNRIVSKSALEHDKTIQELYDWAFSIYRTLIPLE